MLCAEVQCEVMRQVEPNFVRAGILDEGHHQAAAVKVAFLSDHLAVSELGRGDHVLAG